MLVCVLLCRIHARRERRDSFVGSGNKVDALGIELKPDAGFT